MEWFANTPIRNKLILIMFLTAMLALCFAGMGVILNENYSKKKDTEKQLILIADIIAWNSSVALLFNDKITAKEMLNGLSKQPSILGSSLYDKNGDLFATYQSPKANMSEWGSESPISLVQKRNETGKQSAVTSIQTMLGSWLQKLSPSNSDTSMGSSYQHVMHYAPNGQLHLFRPIIQDNDLIGVLHLIDDQSELKMLLARFYKIIVLIVLFTAICIFFLSKKLQQIFLAPLQNLMDAMRSFSQGNTFAQHIKPSGNDEFGEMAMVYSVPLIVMFYPNRVKQ
jgi:methyl-accepting chemotaxis protein